MSSLWYLFFIPALIAIVCGSIILFKKGALVSQKLNAIALMVGGLSIVFYAQYFRPGEENVHWDDISYYTIMLIAMPLYYLAVRHLTTLSGIRLRDYLIFLAPTLVVSFGAVSLYVFNYENGYQFSRVFIAFYVIVMLIWSYNKVKEYYKLQKEYYSVVENTSTDNLRLLSIMALTLIPVAVATWVLSHYHESVALTVVMIVLLSAVLLVIANFLYRIRYSAENLRRRLSEYDAMEKNTAERAVSAENAYAKCLEKLDRAIYEDKVFLDPEISLVSLAVIIKTNRTYLSDAIHLTYGLSFSDFINHLRIEHALASIREKHQKGEDILVKDIALTSGYNISSSFYRAFERETGQTPTQWMKENLK
jgi:AraC-like DNA-binding protein